MINITTLQEFLDHSAVIIGNDVYFSVRMNCYGADHLQHKSQPPLGGRIGSAVSAAFNKVGLGKTVNFLKQPDLEHSGYVAMTVRASLPQLQARANKNADYSCLMIDKSKPGVTALPDQDNSKVDSLLRALKHANVDLVPDDLRTPAGRYPLLRRYDLQSREEWRGYQIGSKDGWDFPLQFDVDVNPQTGIPKPITGVLAPYPFCLGKEPLLTSAELGFWPVGGIKTLLASEPTDIPKPMLA